MPKIKGAIRVTEIGPGKAVSWVVVGVQTGVKLDMSCALPGHKEAGMHVLINIE